MDELDDAAFLNAPPPVSTLEAVVVEDAPVVVETPAVEEEKEVEVVETPAEVETPLVQEPKEETINLPGLGEEKEDKPVVEETKTVEPKTEAPIDYQAFYTDLMGPLKANGKNIEIRSPEDIKQLMRMGANYTRKMQDLAPHRKILAMLENNGMLDESKLSYYIDLDKKNPEAIKKLIKDSGLDPLDIDVSTEANYQQGNHRVSDDEVAFRNILEDVKSAPGGQETLRVIDSTWDQTSKNELWKSPEVLSIIQQQRDNGVYDRITTEINRQTMLGTIPTGTPFVQAYMRIGNELGAKGAFADIGSAGTPAQTVNSKTVTPPVAQVQTPVATRVVAPKPQVTNSAAASAASSTRSSPKRIAPIANLQGMGDEDFMKNWANRL